MRCFLRAVLKDGIVLINIGLKTMRQPGKPMKVMEVIKVGLGLLLELGSNEAQPTDRALKDMKAIYAICKKFLVKSVRLKKNGNASEFI